ncbi:MAG TPA: IS982 family transposase, partial [Caldilineae bacterium]|nr:IS982 family transposase [Caldilineae bacterium]
QVRLAAKAALHNFCIWLNLQYDRQPLAFADLLDW